LRRASWNEGAQPQDRGFHGEVIWDTLWMIV
jgi:hypothetical protein